MSNKLHECNLTGLGLAKYTGCSVQRVGNACSWCIENFSCVTWPGRSSRTLSISVDEENSPGRLRLVP